MGGRPADPDERTRTVATFQVWLNGQSDRPGDDPIGWLSRQWTACEGPERPRVSAPTGIRGHLLALSDDPQWQAAVTRAVELATQAYNDERAPLANEGIELSASLQEAADQRQLTEAELAAFHEQNLGPAGEAAVAGIADEVVQQMASEQQVQELLSPGAAHPDVSGAGVPYGPDSAGQLELLGEATGLLLQSVAALASRTEHLVRLASLTMARLDVIGRALNIEPTALDTQLAEAVTLAGPPTQVSEPAGQLNGWADWMRVADPDPQD
jgi:hypothetical protein